MNRKNTSQKHVALLFSGGRDSSLCACLLARDGYIVHPLTFYNGALIKINISKYRALELKRAFPDNIKDQVMIRSFGLFRKVALENIEDDFAKYKKNLIPVGNSITSHTEAIIYCKKNNISFIANGFNKYQNTFPEQTKAPMAIFKKFLSEYDIEYLTPVYEYNSKEKVKYDLFDFGITTKSLEGVSIFSDSYSQPSQKLLAQYINDKLSICRKHIKLKTGK